MLFRFKEGKQLLAKEKSLLAANFSFLLTFFFIVGKSVPPFWVVWPLLEIISHPPPNCVMEAVADVMKAEPLCLLRALFPSCKIWQYGRANGQKGREERLPCAA